MKTYTCSKDLPVSMTPSSLTLVTSLYIQGSRRPTENLSIIGRRMMAVHGQPQPTYNKRAGSPSSQSPYHCDLAAFEGVQRNHLLKALDNRATE